MSEKPDIDVGKDQTAFSRKIAAIAARKLKLRRKPTQSVWFGLGMMGLVGWSVVVPTLVGTALGIWLDQRHPATHSWTLTLLVVGLAIGCLSAWQWVAKEDKAMRDEQEDLHD